MALSFFFVVSCQKEKLISYKPLQQTDVLARSEQLAREVAVNVPKKAKIAVVDVLDSKTKQTATISAALSENLITDLTRTSNRQYRLVDRTLLKNALKELKLQSSDLFDQRSVKELGKLLGVDYIVSGTITHSDSGATINMRAINVETLEIIGASRTFVGKKMFYSALFISLIILCSAGFLAVLFTTLSKDLRYELGEHNITAKTIIFWSLVFLVELSLLIAGFYLGLRFTMLVPLFVFLTTALIFLIKGA